MAESSHCEGLTRCCLVSLFGERLDFKGRALGPRHQDCSASQLLKIKLYYSGEKREAVQCEKAGKWGGGRTLGKLS